VIESLIIEDFLFLDSFANWGPIMMVMQLQYPFLDPSLALTERVRDLISRLTIEEKAAFIPTRQGAVPRLGIQPYSIGAEGAHGFVDRDGLSTTFPQTIGLASTWDRDLLRRLGEVTGIEARAYYETHDHSGGLALWAPTIDMERDPRWGRTEEGYGEDPFLTGVLASAYIQGVQGEDPFYLRASCGPKHFFANNNENDRGRCSCSIPARCLREYYLAPFKTAITRGRASSMMTAYNRVNGIPMTVHPILKEVVKKEWGFEGYTVTDGGAFLMAVTMHHYFESHGETLAAGFKNGADIQTDDPQPVIAAVQDALSKNLIREADLDEHLARILSIRFRLGHFDPPGSCPYAGINEKDMMKDACRDLAREAVRKSAVLLKNDGNLLPLSPVSAARIAVMGPLADKVYQDWYAGNPPYTCTPLDGLREQFGADRIVFTDSRDIVSFTTADHRPLVVSNGVLSVGKTGETPARFYVDDWGWGARTLTGVETGLLLQTPLPPEPGAPSKPGSVFASGKSDMGWFVTTLFNLVPQEGGLLLWKTWDNRRLRTSDREGPVGLTTRPVPGDGELFRMRVEREGLAAASEAAAEADRVIVFAGNNPMINGREEVDRPSLDLPPRQEELIRLVSDRNPHTILALISGYPFTCGRAIERVPAVLWTAHGMQELGHGLADILSGSSSPGGRLPMTWYEDIKQLPPMMEYDIISARSTYQYFPGKVLWPFGHGLSYSSFVYSDLRLDRSVATADETVQVSCTVKNTGSVVGEEVPQLYVRVSGSRVRRPIKTLKGFTRLSLAPGEEQLVRFALPMEELAIWDTTRDRFCVEQGYCTIAVGSSSADIRLTGGFEVAGETIPPRNILVPVYAESFDDYSACFLHEKRGSGIPGVFNRADGGWVRYGDADFGAGAETLSAIVSGEPGSRIEIHLDAPDGFCAGIIPVPNTGDVCAYPIPEDSPRRISAWGYTTGSIAAVKGVHDVYLVFYGKTGLWRFSLGGIQ
jgi:beta-glucosidase